MVSAYREIVLRRLQVSRLILEDKFEAQGILFKAMRDHCSIGAVRKISILGLGDEKSGSYMITDLRLPILLSRVVRESLEVKF